MDRKLVLVGSVISNQETQILSQAAGEITDLKFNLGDFKTKGSLLALVDNKVKKLALETANSTMQNSMRTLQSIKSYMKEMLLQRPSIVTLEFASENARIQVDQAKQQLEYTRG